MQEAHQRRLLMKAACHLGTCAHIFVGIQKTAHCFGLNVCVPQIHMLKSLLWSKCVCPPNSHVEIIAMVWMSVSPKFTCWNPNPQRDGIKRWDLWELRSWGQSLRNGISALIKEAQESSLTPFPMGGYSEKTTINKELTPESANTRLLDFLPSRNVRTKYSLFISHLNLWHFVKAAWID